MTKLPQAVPTVQVDNERVRVTEWRFAPGAETGEHVHQMDYVVVPLGDGRLKLVSAAGEESPPEDAPSVRFWLSHQQIAAFSKQAENVLTAGRPLCPRCGLPMDAAGHPCPVNNGARPIF